MKVALEDLIARIAVLLAALVTPSIKRALERWFSGLQSDAPQIGAAWVVRFDDVGSNDKVRPALIDVQLHQYGRRVTGSGILQGDPADPFTYRGVIVRNVFYGTFRRTNAQVLAGTGTFVLKISADSKHMAGQCSWYDNEIDNVWASQYAWKRD